VGDEACYFITATGTDLGKTWVTAGLLAALRRRDVAVRALKPVMCGFDPADAAASDAGKLLQKVMRSGIQPDGTSATASEVAAIAPWRFAAAHSADRAAEFEGRSIDFDELVGWCREQLADNDGVLLIEGVGGVMVPLDGRHTVREWIAALGLPTLLVAGTYLGALSHTLTALSALREAGITSCAIVVNESTDSGVGVEDTVAALAPHIGDIGLIIVKRDDAAGIERLADFLMESSE